MKVVSQTGLDMASGGAVDASTAVLICVSVAGVVDKTNACVSEVAADVVGTKNAGGL